MTDAPSGDSGGAPGGGDQTTLTTTPDGDGFLSILNVGVDWQYSL